MWPVGTAGTAVISVSPAHVSAAVCLVATSATDLWGSRPSDGRLNAQPAGTPCQFEEVLRCGCMCV